METKEQPRKSTHIKIFILWDMVDFPVDEDKIHSFYRSLMSSLRDEHYCGQLCMAAYGHGEDSSLLGTESVHTHIRLFRLKDRFARHNTMLVDMISLLRLNRQANFMLIMKGMAEKGIKYDYVIQEVKKKKNYSVLLVVDDDKDEDNSRYPPDVLSGCTVWTWRSLLRGEPPTRREDDEEDDEEDDDDSYTSDEGSSPKRRKKFDDDAGAASILCPP